MLSLIGLGVSSGDLSLSAFNQIKNCDLVVLRTENTPSCAFLKENQIDYITLDDEYTRARNFDTLSKNLAKKVLVLAKEKSVCYLVDGAVSEDSSCKIILKKKKNCQIFEGVSKAKSVMTKCGIISPSFCAVSAYDLDGFDNPSFPLVLFDLDSRILAGEWKITLSNLVGEERKVWLYIDKQPKLINLYELDRFDNYDYSTALVIDKVDLLDKQRFNYNDLYDIVKLLRAPNGCPWDRAQTKETVRKNLIEECYELVDAIDLNDDDKILEEIGDVLLQAVFHTVFAEERGAFTCCDVFTDECKKLIFRHSHIFGKDKAKNASDALDVWDKNKQIEKGFSSPKDYVLDVPKHFPALVRADKCIKRVNKYCKSTLTACEIKNAILKIINGDNFDAKNLQALILLVSMLFKQRGVDAEESLYFAVQDFVNTFAKFESEFDCKKYIDGLI